MWKVMLAVLVATLLGQHASAQDDLVQGSERVLGLFGDSYLSASRACDDMTALANADGVRVVGANVYHTCGTSGSFSFDYLDAAACAAHGRIECGGHANLLVQFIEDGPYTYCLYHLGQNDVDRTEPVSQEAFEYATGWILDKLLETQTCEHIWMEHINYVYVVHNAGDAAAVASWNLLNSSITAFIDGYDQVSMGANHLDPKWAAYRDLDPPSAHLNEEGQALSSQEAWSVINYVPEPDQGVLGGAALVTLLMLRGLHRPRRRTTAASALN